jgi:phage tail tape-measure protein
MAAKRTNKNRERDVTVSEQREQIREDARNEDPITGEAGAHPVGAGLGAAAGGAAAGAAVGAVAGPVGAAVGIVAGGLAGGLAGKEIAERIDPTVEEHHWRNEYPSREYYDPDVDYEEVGPAYRYGWESRAKYHDRSFDEAESDLARDWNAQRGKSSLDWQRARPATRDAWQRVDTIVVGEVDDDSGRCEMEQSGAPIPRVPK